MNEFVRFINLPQPPEWVILAAKEEILNKNNSPEIFDLSPITSPCEPAETITINNKIFHYGEFYTHNFSNKLIEWFKHSLPSGIIPNGALVTKGNLWPHQDMNVQWSINYIIEPGGDNVETYWCQAQGMELRPGYYGLPYWRHHTGLQEVYSCQLPVKKWFVIPVDIVHGTRNQTGDRISLSAKLSTSKFKILQKIYEFTY